MAPTTAYPRILDVTALASPRMEPRQLDRLRRLLVRLASCDVGRRLLNVAIDHRVTVRFGSRSELHNIRGQAGGYYCGRRKLIVIAANAPFDWQVTAMAHELQHFVDDVFGWELGTVQAEVRAQQTEGVAIQQLRLDKTVVDTWALDAVGRLVHPREIAAKVRNHRLYRRNTEEPSRFDGRIHSLLELHEVLPPADVQRLRTSGGTRIGAVSQIAVTGPVAPVQRVSTGPVTMAASGALGARTPTGWDPTADALAQTDIERFLQLLDARRLATGA